MTGVEDADIEQAAARLLTWLACTDRRWLIVLDDLIDPDDLTGLWPLDTDAGRTVVTTRRRDAALTAGRQLIDVDPFTEAESVAYLTSKLADQPILNDDPAGVASDLGHLPLALAQATAYMLDRNLSCTAYRRRLADRSLDQLRPLSLPDQYRVMFSATWQLSIDLADRLTVSGVATPLLELVALLDPNGIPTKLFTTDTIAGYCARRTGHNIDADETRDSLHVLDRLNLVTIDDTQHTVRIHALVQRTVREATDPEHFDELATVAAEALLSSWPDTDRDEASTQTLRANAVALFHSTGDALITGGCHKLLTRCAASLAAIGLPAAAISMLVHLLRRCMQILGTDHPDMLLVRHDLAVWTGQAGDARAAATALEDLLHDQFRVHGPAHANTLSTRHELAVWRAQAGDANGAAEALTGLLADRLRRLGPDHRDTLVTRANLARAHAVTGNAAAAVTEFRSCCRTPGGYSALITSTPSLLGTRSRSGSVSAATQLAPSPRSKRSLPTLYGSTGPTTRIP